MIKPEFVRPTVGDGATMYVGSDCYPYTVVKVSPSGKTIEMREDHYRIVSGDGSFQRGIPEISYSPQPNAVPLTVRYTNRGWRWRGSPVSVGFRRYYRDPHV